MSNTLLIILAGLAATLALLVTSLGRLRELQARQGVLETRARESDALAREMQDVRQRLVRGVEVEEERDRLFNLSVDMLSIGGYDGFLEQVNPAWVRVLGWSRDDLMGRPLLSFVHPADKRTVTAAIRELEAGERVDGIECRFECRDGRYRWLSWNSFPYADRRQIFSVVRDITDAKEAEQQLLGYQERLRALSNQLSLVEDRERRQLAEAIHDGLAQQLFGLRAQVTLLKYPEKLADPRALVDEIIGILDEALTQARSLTFELFPPVLYEVGLAAALEWLGRQFEHRTGIACEVDTDAGEPDLPEDLRMMAYQSVRELLVNAGKHAGAREVRIELELPAGHVRLTVRDDGRGFDPETVEGTVPSAAGGGFGLFSMRERLRSVGGRLRVVSAAGQGSTMELTFPASLPEA